MRASWWSRLLAAVGWLSAVVALAAQVSAEEATSNLASWAQLLGVDQIPGWLASPSIDARATIAGIAVGLISLVAWLVIRGRRKLGTELPAPMPRYEALWLARELEQRMKRGQLILAGRRPILVTQVEGWLAETTPLVAKLGEDERSLFESIVPFLPGNIHVDCAPHLEAYLTKLRLIVARAFKKAETERQRK